MKIVILPSALADLREGSDYYELQDAGLGFYFEDCIFRDIDALKHNAGVHRKVHAHHRAISRRFSHAIYYTLEDKVIVVRRVLDCRRDPNWIRKQLR